MALDKTSTLKDVLDQIKDNQDYDIENSVPKAKLLISGLRALLLFADEEIEKSSERVKNQWRAAESELEKVMTWWQVNDPNATTSSGKTGQIVHADFTEFRE